LSRESRAEEETLALARELGRRLRAGDWIALMGELGSGKTVFARGLAEGMGIAERPTSPTFAIVQVHRSQGPGRPALRHVDLYRLPPPEIPGLEWEELHDDAGVTVVEWAEKAQYLWPAQCLPVRLSHQGADRRRIEFYVCGPRSGDLVRQMKGKP